MRGGVQTPPKKHDIIYEELLNRNNKFYFIHIVISIGLLFPKHNLNDTSMVIKPYVQPFSKDLKALQVVNGHLKTQHT